MAKSNPDLLFPKGTLLIEDTVEEFPKSLGGGESRSSRIFFTTNEVPAHPPKNQLYHFVQIADSYSQRSEGWRVSLSNYNAPAPADDIKGITRTMVEITPDDLEKVLSQAAAAYGTRYLAYVSDLLAQSADDSYFRHLTPDSKAMLRKALDKAITSASTSQIVPTVRRLL